VLGILENKIGTPGSSMASEKIIELRIVSLPKLIEMET
jgi:hypothetical protein